MGSSQADHRVKAWQPSEMGYWTCLFYLCGSSSWIVNAVLLFHELSPSDSPAVAWSAFCGGTFFLFGGLCHFWELLNIGHEGEFGRAVRCLVVDGGDVQDKDDRALELSSDDTLDITASATASSRKSNEWRWWFHVKDLRRLADATGASELLAVSVFWISVLYGVTANPARMSPGLNNAFFWTPQVIGAFFLTLSSVLSTSLSQDRWYKPALGNADWHVGFWNVVGSVGFFASGFAGYFIELWPGVEVYGVYLSTYWGSYAFMVGSVLQTIVFFWRH